MPLLFAIQDQKSNAASATSRVLPRECSAQGVIESHAKRAMSLRLIDEHENRLWPARIGNRRLFDRALSIPIECFHTSREDREGDYYRPATELRALPRTSA